MEAIPITLSEITKEWVAAQLNTKNLTGIRLEPMGEGVGMMRRGRSQVGSAGDAAGWGKRTG